MMVWLRRAAIAILGRYGATLRFPHLLLLAGAIFVINLIVPDPLPLVDELFLGLVTLLFATWRDERKKKDADLAERTTQRPPR